MSFVHLHLHTVYSVLDGIIKVDKLAARVKQLGMPAVAITDHGNLYGVIEFYKAAKKEGIKPIIGCEVYVTADEDNTAKETRVRDNYHLILLAQNKQGLRNLFWLISNANLSNFYYKPRIYLRHLEKYSEGLIATSACLGGVISGQLRYDEETKSTCDPEGKGRAMADYFSKIFPGRFYLELQDHEGMWEQPRYNEWLIDLAREKQLPLIFSTDAHYLNKEDYSTHKLIMAQQFKKTLVEYNTDNKMIYGSDYYVKSPDEMKELANKWGHPEAIDNTLSIAEQCNVEIELGKYKMPEFDITVEQDYEDFKRWKEQKNEQV